MKNRILSLFIAIVTLLSLVACNDGVSQEEYDKLLDEVNKLKENNESNPSESENENNLSGDTSSDNPIASPVGNNPPPTDLEETSASDFEYEYDAALGGVVIKKYMGAAFRIRIPDVIDEYPVTGIGAGLGDTTLGHDTLLQGAFEGSRGSRITYVYIPNSVTSIGFRAFANCNGLTNITIPNDTNIHFSAFEGCDNISITRLSRENSYSTATIGDIIQFGWLEWRILDIQDGKALIISDEIIVSQPYHTSLVDITWENSSIRQYLNDTVYNTIFNDEEKSKITETLGINNDNPYYGTPGGNNTTDKIFLLSIDEAERYFSSASSRIAYSRDEYSYEGRAFDWWLRSPDHLSDYAVCVISDGDILHNGVWNSVTTKRGIRPALWLNLG